jgi:tetratricopeptide (TPR) repeat protein
VKGGPQPSAGWGATVGQRRRGRDLLAGALLVGATLAAYLPALRGGFVWDDDATLTNNPLVKAADGLRRIWFTTQAKDYWPVTYSALWAEWRVWGANPFWYHLTNVLLHAASACLIAAILGRLFGRAESGSPAEVPRIRRKGAPSFAEAPERLQSLAPWLAAFLFALHPVNVESVAWITQQKNLWAMLFSLLSILSFIPADTATDAPAAKRQDAPGEASAKAAPPPFLSLAFFTLAMLSKGSAAPIPVVLLGLILWRRRLTRRDLLHLAPFFAVSVILVAADLRFQARDALGEAIRSAGIPERLLGAGAVVWFYLGKSLFPAGLSFVYPQWHVRTDALGWWIPLASAAAVTVALFALRKRSWGRPLFFVWACFCAMLVPVMGLADAYFMKYSLVADHYAYMAQVAAVAVAALAWDRLRPGRPNLERAAVALAAGVVCALGVLTWRQCETYRDTRTLYEATLRRNPDAWLIHYNLGEMLLEERRIPEAAAHFRDALRARPDYMEAHNNLGIALAEMNQVPLAVAEFREAVRLKPEYAPARVNLGNALAQTGHPTEAVGQFREAVRLEPDYAEAHRGLGLALHALDRDAEAVPEMRLAERLDAKR